MPNDGIRSDKLKGRCHLRLEQITSKLEQLFRFKNRSINSSSFETSQSDSSKLLKSQIKFEANIMGSIEDKQIVEQTNVESSEPDSQEENVKNVQVVVAADESAKENTEPNSMDAKKSADSQNEAGKQEEKSVTQDQSLGEKHQDEPEKRDEQDQQLHQHDQEQDQHNQDQQIQQPMINCEVMQSSQKRGNLEQAEKSVQFGEQPEISSTTPSGNTPTNTTGKSHRGARGYSRRQQGRNYVTGSYQNNYGLLHLPYKSNFEPSEAARRRADEFFKSLNVSN